VDGTCKSLDEFQAFYDKEEKSWVTLIQEQGIKAE